jgi:hypothetical protein
MDWAPLNTDGKAEWPTKQRKSWFLVLGILYGVQDKFPDDVSGAAVGLIFNGHKLER